MGLFCCGLKGVLFAYAVEKQVKGCPVEKWGVYFGGEHGLVAF